MQPKSVIFLGSKPIGFECFRNLILRRDDLNIRIIGLLTQERKEFGAGQDLAGLAGANQIPIIDQLDDMPECDILYSVQYHQILAQRHIDKASQAAVNLHMAPLPEYRGSNQFSFAIIDGKTEFGTTIHLMSAGIDSGAILFQKRFPIPDQCWVGQLYELTYRASLNLFEQTLAHVIEGRFNPVPQELLAGKYGTSLHLRKEMAMIKVIDLSWDKETIERHVRACAMPGFEPPYCIIDGKKMYFTNKY